ncbi:MAG: EamA family transporter [Lachnospiraceae bacterium]|jgi:transporter family protein|nr:EamA family transporter [Lachnospiraceae bacterium]MCH4030890.1 EamA family transporter [Lachnospiraceae bacterium]MCH4070862.1 EamA family transporter [Lachnospiraceae bacterium]MCI1362292.1 EamA family transporter [Lachnospiraceae bacterium]MCI1402644.1 EamA family transporter [Lachnospiraceae bacterium]
MWIVFAFGSAFFAGITAILAKCGIKQTDSTVATAVRTIIVLIFSWLMVLVTGQMDGIGSIGGRTWIFLILSGLATGFSWLCYFHALQIGDVNKVVPIDKTSTILTILLAFLFLGEPVTWASGVGIVLIGLGTFLMIEKKRTANAAAAETADGSGKTAVIAGKRPGRGWMFYAFGSAIFASLTSILGKIGIENIASNLGTAIRTCVVLVMAWMMVLVTGKTGKVHEIQRGELAFICLSGVATGASWLCYYRALQIGPASVVVPIDKLSIVVSIIFSRIVFGEKLSARALAGLILIVAGTMVMVVAA